MQGLARLSLTWFLAATTILLAAQHWEIGRFGGQLCIAERAEPKTLNPITAVDAVSRDIIRRTTADLISINRETQQTEAALAESFTESRDGLHYTISLREGLRFSDGQPFSADDVVFSWQVYLDEKSSSPQRDLLLIDGKPIQAVKLDRRHVRFDLPAPYAAAERLFDSVAMLPKHLLERPWHEGRIAQMWNTSTSPSEIAGLGPFRLRQYQPGESAELERNPYYWKRNDTGQQLPYLDSIRFLFVQNEDMQVLRFASGETQILNRVSARAAALADSASLIDAGPGLDYSFLFFNLGKGGKPFFRNTAFRRAVSLVADRDAMVRLVFAGHAYPLSTHVAPGNRLWMNTRIPKPERSISGAEKTLRDAGFRKGPEGNLRDPDGAPVEFSIIVSAANTDRVKMAAILQEDLRQLGVNVQVVPLESRSVIDRVTNTRQFDACILALGGGDADPNSEMGVWLSSGSMHLWNPEQKSPATPWEQEINQIMRKQMSELNHTARKKLFDRLQEIEAVELPIISLVSPSVLVGSKGVGNFKPAVLDPYTLWNAEYLFLRSSANR